MNKLLINKFKQVVDPYLCNNYIDEGLLCENNGVFRLILPYPCQLDHADIKKKLLSAINNESTIEINTNISAHQANSNIINNSNIKNIIVIASGKGGVGKTTTAVNLALALHAEGTKVGVLDADIHGPSLASALGANTNKEPEVENKLFLKPIISHGVCSMSMAYFINDSDAVSWRGPKLSGALLQLYQQTLWGELDYLIIDTPPGTGDIHLTIAKQLPVSGIVIVTTPQDLALLDARKSINFFQKVSLPILGIVENMGTHICQNCGHEEAIFGKDGVKKLEEDFAASMLGSIPLNINIRKHGDSGKALVTGEPDDEISKHYRHIAKQIAANIELNVAKRQAHIPMKNI